MEELKDLKTVIHYSWMGVQKVAPKDLKTVIYYSWMEVQKVQLTVVHCCRLASHLEELKDLKTVIHYFRKVVLMVSKKVVNLDQMTKNNLVPTMAQILVRLMGSRKSFLKDLLMKLCSVMMMVHLMKPLTVLKMVNS